MDKDNVEQRAAARSAHAKRVADRRAAAQLEAAQKATVQRENAKRDAERAAAERAADLRAAADRVTAQRAAEQRAAEQRRSAPRGGALLGRALRGGAVGCSVWVGGAQRVDEERAAAQLQAVITATIQREAAKRDAERAAAKRAAKLRAAAARIAEQRAAEQCYSAQRGGALRGDALGSGAQQAVSGESVDYWKSDEPEVFDDEVEYDHRTEEEKQEEKRMDEIKQEVDKWCSNNFSDERIYQPERLATMAVQVMSDTRQVSEQHVQYWRDNLDRLKPAEWKFSSTEPNNLDTVDISDAVHFSLFSQDAATIVSRRLHGRVYQIRFEFCSPLHKHFEDEYGRCAGTMIYFRNESASLPIKTFDTAHFVQPGGTPKPSTVCSVNWKGKFKGLGLPLGVLWIKLCTECDKNGYGCGTMEQLEMMEHFSFYAPIPEGYEVTIYADRSTEFVSKDVVKTVVDTAYGLWNTGKLKKLTFFGCGTFEDLKAFCEPLDIDNKHLYRNELDRMRGEHFIGKVDCQKLCEIENIDQSFCSHCMDDALPLFPSLRQRGRHIRLLDEYHEYGIHSNGKGKQEGHVEIDYDDSGKRSFKAIL